MAKTMTPSAITDGQISKAVGLYRAMLEKHRSEFGSAPVQQILGQPEFVGEMVSVLRRRVEAVSDMIVRHVRVDRTRIPQQALEVTGRRHYIDPDVVKTMPRGEGEEVEVYFFRLRRYVSEEELEKEYRLRGLKPADPYSLAAANEADPIFADDHPNATHWKNAGEWCYMAFSRWSDERGVDVDRGAGDWDGHWWFAGLRK